MGQVRGHGSQAVPDHPSLQHGQAPPGAPPRGASGVPPYPSPPLVPPLPGLSIVCRIGPRRIVCYHERWRGTREGAVGIFPAGSTPPARTTPARVAQGIPKPAADER